MNPTILALQEMSKAHIPKVTVIWQIPIRISGQWKGLFMGIRIVIKMVHHKCRTFLLDPATHGNESIPLAYCVGEMTRKEIAVCN